MRRIVVRPQRKLPEPTKHSDRVADESGLTMAVVAIAMVVIVGAIALTADMGNGWRVRRALVPATDAGALAAAQDFVDGDNGCTNGTAANYVDFNETLAVMTVCDPYTYPSGDQGRVSVTAEQTLNTWFATVLGINQFTVESTSTAVWGPPAAVTGLRPIGLCYDGSTQLQNFIDNPPATETLLRIDYDKDQPNACADDGVWEGNWGTIDFDSGGPSNSDTKDWVLNGYDGLVYFENHSVTSCAGPEAHCYDADTGALAGIQNELTTLMNSGQYFTLPVFNFAEGSGANPNLAFAHLMGIIRVRLVDFKVNGQPSGRFFELMVKPGLVTGTCCGGGSGASGNKVITICGVDPGQFAACDP